MALISSTPTLKRKRLFYCQEDDLVLLREVAAQNPYEDGGKWNTIQKNVQEATGKAFTERSLQNRVANLAEKYQKKMEEDQFKSGIEENVTELDDLLISIIILIKDFKVKTPKAKATPYQIGYERREATANLATVKASVDLFEDYQENPDIIFEVTDEIENLQEAQEEDYDIHDNNKEQREDLNNKNKEKENEISDRNKDEIVTKGKGRARGRGRGGVIGTSSKPRSSLKYSSIKFLEKKNDRWYEIRKRELDLEEKRYLLEKADREKKMKWKKEESNWMKKNYRQSWSYLTINKN